MGRKQPLLSILPILLLPAFAHPFNTPSSFTGRPSFISSPAATVEATTTSSKTGNENDTDNPILPEFDSLESYISYLEPRSALPKGFQVASAWTKFIPAEAPVMGPLPIRSTIIYLPEGPTTSWTAVFTKNRFPGAPIKVGKTRLGGSLQAIVINNKVSNVCSATGGVEDAEVVCAAVAKTLGLEGGGASVLPSSTGVIGWRLPRDELAAVVPDVVSGLQGDSALPLAQGITTTDRYPKLRSVTLSSGARVVGCAKGAGMIEPNMATMLCYILTDAKLTSGVAWDNLLAPAVDVSFNAISVDGDESTSDTAVLISTEKIESDEQEFRDALTTVCQSLAADMVRNGEGTSHVIRVTLKNYTIDRKTVIKLGRHIVNSPLFKCAVAGNDPNIGRLAAAVGSFLGKLDDQAAIDPSKIIFSIGGDVIFADGQFRIDGDETEKKLSDYMMDAQFNELEEYPSHQKFVDVVVDFGEGTGESIAVLGSDLTAEYVKVNADYRS